jgi:hypothetical protein
MNSVGPSGGASGAAAPLLASRKGLAIKLMVATSSKKAVFFIRVIRG